MDLSRITWLPPALELMSAAFAYFALKVAASPVVQTWTPEGMKPLAVISIERPVVGWVALGLLVVGLVLEIAIGIKEAKTRATANAS